MILQEIKNIKSRKKELREFGVVVGVVFGLIGGLFWWRGKDHYSIFLTVSIALVILGLIAPVLLKPLHKIWMAFAIIIGWIMTRIILSILFYLLITPIGLLKRLSDKDMLDLRFDKNKNSYWIPRQQEAFDKVSYEKQF